MAASPKRRIPGDSTDVSRIEHENVESAVRENARRIERVDAKIDAISRELAELKKLIRTLASSNRQISA